VLASGSPQRREILERLGVPFTLRPSWAPELEHGDPAELVLENALRKARAAHVPAANEVVLACDTVVALGGVLYGKPAGERVARETLSALSGVTHEVLSGLALLWAGEPPAGSEPCPPGSEPCPPGAGGHAQRQATQAPRTALTRTALTRTAVTFRVLGDELLDWYLATGEWRGRAGGYAIQGAGAALVRAVEGDYENVVGLPLATLLDLYPALLKR
jgi:septum formation protein